MKKKTKKTFDTMWDIFMTMSWKTPRTAKVEHLELNDIPCSPMDEDWVINFTYAKLCFVDYCYEMDMTDECIDEYLDYINSL